VKKRDGLLFHAATSTLRGMRYWAWLAIFSLQIGMFVCGSGIDICHANAAPVSVKISHVDANPEKSSDVDAVCVAHAAHVFFWQETDDQIQINGHPKRTSFFITQYIPEFFNQIEQPPKSLHS